ncbi:MAG: peptide deformylase [Planctomycetota bacterium]|nr:MAG: peptide deformylase [Planctomycetota bacterium]
MVLCGGIIVKKYIQQNYHPIALKNPERYCNRIRVVLYLTVEATAPENEATMEILKYPDPALNGRAEPLTGDELTEKLKKTFREMFAIIYKAKGIGLAGPQVGIPKRFFVINPTGKPEDEQVCINPEITRKEGTLHEEEGCLSFPGLLGKVVRAAKVEIKYTDASGTEHKKTFEGFGARAVQHEIDHLDGVLFITHLSPAARSALKAKLNELEREFAKSAK